MKLGEIIVKNAIIANLESTERDDVLQELVDAMVASGELPEDMKAEILEHLIEREQSGSTGFGKGVAIPHARSEKLEGMSATIGISQKGVDFNALDKQPVYSIVMLLSPADKQDEHLQAMESIFRNLQDATFRSFLRQATSTDQVLDLIEEKDSNKL